MRYEEKSTIFITNANFRSWGDIFQDPKIAKAILDRILHHATIVNIAGDFYRLKVKKTKVYILILTIIMKVLSIFEITYRTL